MLDANFALIKPSMGSGLVLFDTCDIHLSKEKTADKFGKKLGDVVVLGQDVHFNGAFLEESAIPYLATSGMVIHQFNNFHCCQLQKNKICQYIFQSIFFPTVESTTST